MVLSLVIVESILPTKTFILLSQHRVKRYNFLSFFLFSRGEKKKKTFQVSYVPKTKDYKIFPLYPAV